MLWCDDENIRSVLYKLPCCLRTRTYHPQPCVHMPPGSPFDGPSVLRGLGWGIWLVHWRVKQRNTKLIERLVHHIYFVSKWQNLSIYNATFTSLDLQFVHQVGAQVLSDMFMPGLPYPWSRERGGSRQVSHASRYRPIWHQLTVRYGEKETITQVQLHTRFQKQNNVHKGRNLQFVLQDTFWKCV